MKLKLSQIKDFIDGATVLFNGREIDVTSICYDSRQVIDGSLFVAMKGEKTDGHQFLNDAIKRGAIALVTQRKIDTAISLPQIIVPDSRRVLSMLSHRFYDNPSEKIKVIGITGTTGKTTTAYLIRAILEAAGNKVGMLGTISYSIGNREIPAPMTTPESYDIAGYLSEMASQGLSYAVMEVSSHSLVQKRVNDIKFASAVFTNLGRDHMDFHKTVEGYRNAKSILFSLLSGESKAVLNDDDSSSAYFESVTKAKTMKYSLKGKSEFNAEIKSNSLEGLSLVIHAPSGDIQIKSPLIGRHNAYNILSAVTAVYSAGVKDHKAIAKGVESVKSVRGRSEIVVTDKPFKVLVDFAHTPDALEKALESLKGLVKGKLIAVFGCGGDRDKGKRPLMGKAVENYADIMVLTSDNPRSEDPESIIKDIEKGLTGKNKYEVEPDRRRAIEKALNMAKSGDLVLIAGKGHETYQIFKDTVKSFDDREVVEEILGLRFNSPADKFARIKMLL